MPPNVGLQISPRDVCVNSPTPSSAVETPAIADPAFAPSRVAVWHELVHALAAVHLDVVDGPRFMRVFGAGHEHEWDERPRFDPQLFITDYATKSLAEDFADTAMVYTRHRGRVERYAGREGVMEGFVFVRWVAERLR